MSVQKKGLGSKGLGLDALINTQISDFNEKNKDGIIEIDINKVEPNRNQPRKHFEENALEELAESIKEYGIIQPLIVKRVEDYYEIVAGERRWRAAKIAGLKKVPIIVKTFDTTKSFEIALVENIQREDLNPIEEALSYKELGESLNLNQEEIAEKVGKKRSTVTNSLRLLNLDKRVQNFIIENKITNGHAKVLLAIENNDIQFELAEKIIEEELSVRETEKLLKRIFSKNDGSINLKSTVFSTGNYKKLEDDLKNMLGTKVKLSAGKNKGKIEIEYYSDSDLDRLMGLIKNIEN